MLREIEHYLNPNVLIDGADRDRGLRHGLDLGDAAV